MRKLPEAQTLLKNSEFSKKIYLYFATPSYGADYDSYEANVTYELLNPVCIKGYVSEVSPGALVFKEIGLHKQGAIEILTEQKYASWFENCAKVTVDGIDYQVYKHGGGRAYIQNRPLKLAKITLTRS